MRKILIVVDMQNDFIDGALGTPEARAIVPAVTEKIRRYAPENIFATQDTHGENYLDTQEGKFLPIVHCVRGTDGWRLREEVAAALRGARVIEKQTFGSTELASTLAAMYAREPIAIEMVGLCTDICVVSNALLLKAALCETPITVDASCCAGSTPERARAALETLRSCQIYVR